MNTGFTARADAVNYGGDLAKVYDIDNQARIITGEELRALLKRHPAALVNFLLEENTQGRPELAVFVGDLSWQTEPIK